MPRSWSSYGATTTTLLFRLWRALLTRYDALVKHPDFDTWIYLLLYSMISMFLETIVYGALCRVIADLGHHSRIDRLATIFGPQSPFIWLTFSKQYVDAIVLVWSTKSVNARAEEITNRFERLNAFLTTEGWNPFSTLFTTLPVFSAGTVGFLIGWLAVFTTEWGRVVARYADWIVDLHDTQPKSFMAIMIAGIASVAWLYVVLCGDPEYLDLHEIPTSWLAARITNAITCFIRRRRVTKRRTTASFAFTLADSTSDEYEYDELRHGQFRLLELDAERGCAKLNTTSISTLSKFDAISYYWGAKDLAHAIKINDGLGRVRTIKITTNAHEVLTTLFPLHGVRYIWIDSICINQQSADEKNAQIPLMQEIYGRAERVVAYLQSDELSSVANNMLTRAIWHAVSFSAFDSSVAFRTSVPFPTDHRGWRAFRELAGNEFWSRVWVLQEMIVAQKLVIHNGNADLPWRIMLQFDAWFRGYRMKAPFTNIDARSPGALLYTQADLSTTYLIMLNERAKREHGTSHKMADLLVDTRHLKASQAEDKVYALLGLTDYYTRIILRPNSTQSVEDIYTAATLYCLSNGGVVLLSMAGLCHKEVQQLLPLHKEPETVIQGNVAVNLNGSSVLPRKLCLPSWVPNFQDPPRVPSFDLYERGYKAGGKDARNLLFEHHDGKLDVACWVVDVVAECADESKRPELGVYPLHMRAEDHNKRHATWYTPEHPDNAMRRMHNIFEEVLRIMRQPWVQQRYDAVIGPDDFHAVTEYTVALTAIEEWDGKTYPATETTFASYAGFKRMMVMVDAGLRAPASSTATPATQEKQFRKLFKNQLDNATWMPYLLRAEDVSLRRKFAVTVQGRAAMVPRGTEPGDIICVLKGSPVPHLLRRVEGRDDEYRFFGDAFVYGLMNGSVIGAEMTRITLI